MPERFVKPEKIPLKSTSASVREEQAEFLKESFPKNGASEFFRFLIDNSIEFKEWRKKKNDKTN